MGPPGFSQASPSGFSLLGRHDSGAAIAWRAGRLLTVEDLRQEAARIAASVPEAIAGEEILIVCGDRWWFTAALLAAWHKGYVVALPPNLQPQTLRELLAQPPICRILHDGGVRGDWGNGFDVRAGGEPAADFPEVLEISPSCRLATLYTSGATGRSVGWRKLASQLLGEAELQGRLLGLEGGARMLATAPPQHIYGLLMGILVPLVSGGAMVCGQALLPEAVSALSRESGATHIASVPAHLRALALMAGDIGLALGKVRTVVSSSAALEPETSRMLVAAGLRVVELLGSTETGGIASRSPPEDDWRPLPGVTVDVDSQGRMLVSSPFLDSAGSRPHVTSDLIVLQPGGAFEHLGRRDGVIKVGGRRIALQELESYLRRLPGVVDVALQSFPSNDARGNSIWAMVVAPELQVPDLRKALLERFDPVVVPRHWRLLHTLPRELSGKITQAAWLAAFGKGREPEPSVHDVAVQERLTKEQDGVTSLDVRLWVPPNLSYFRGHFDGLPVLSGIFILNQLVVKESRQTWPDLGVAKGLSRVKFRSPIFPRAVVLMSLRRREHQPTVEFSLLSNGRECSSGTVLFERSA